MSDPYRFPGMPGFVKCEGLKPSFVPKVAGVWFAQRVADSLSQIPTAPPEHRREMYAVAREAMGAIHACFDMCTRAFDEVMSHCPPPDDPDDPPLTVADPHGTTRPVTPDPGPIAAEPATKGKPKKTEDTP